LRTRPKLLPPSRRQLDSPRHPLRPRHLRDSVL
jgi:hypothetical protein